MYMAAVIKISYIQDENIRRYRDQKAGVRRHFSRVMAGRGGGGFV